VVAVLLIFFVIGFVGLSLVDGYVKDNSTSSIRKDSRQMVAPFIFDMKAKSSSTFCKDDSLGYFSTRGALTSKESAKYFFKNILPLELSLQTWYSKFWIRALEYHPILGLLAPSKGRSYFHAKKWLFMSLSSLIYYL